MISRNNLLRTSFIWMVYIRYVTFQIHHCCCYAETVDADNDDITFKNNLSDITNNKPNNTAGILVEESYIKGRTKIRQTWANAFSEIKSLMGINNGTTLSSKQFSSAFRSGSTSNKNNDVSIRSNTNNISISLLNEWKFIVDSSKTKKRTKSLSPSFEVDRFKGYMNWERRLEEWEEEVIDYLETKILMNNNEEENVNATTTASSKLVATSEDMDEKMNNNDGVPSSKSFSLLKKKKNTDNNKVNKQPLYDVKFTFPVIPTPKSKPDEPVVPYTDVSDKSKNIWIVTTAALPWMTGTAVNPLLRAAYLTRGRKGAGGSVTLLIPWLEKDDDQKSVYGQAKRFTSQDDQEEYIRTWLRDSANLPREAEDLKIAWYTAWQEKAENSIYSMGDITALIPKDEADICVLEEPEHLNWYRAPGENWTDKFKHVVGIVHTNYFVYAQEQPAAVVRAPAMKLLCSWMCRAHCHRLIKLSATLDNFAPEKELVENVHGVRPTFLDIGKEVALRLSKDAPVVGKANDPIFGADAEPKVYFIGKMLWSKGLGSLMELMKYAEENADLKFHIDMYGGGPNKDDATKRSKKMNLDMTFHGPKDHALLGTTHKIFINPSTSEVLCTTSAEALAMGKFVILPSHPSNDFFAQFPNCLPYTTKEEFVANLYYALTHSPEPMSDEYSYALSWEAATERFESAACITVAESDALKKAYSELQVGLDIDLPPIIEDGQRRSRIVATLERTRERYRIFRENLKDEIQQQRFLPDELRDRMLIELDKRFELNFEEFFGSPKLKVLRLSPAELDRQLLDLHDSVSRSPSGDLLRIIGGGTNVGAQNFYLKQQARKQRKAQKQNISGGGTLLSSSMNANNTTTISPVAIMNDSTINELISGMFEESSSATPTNNNSARGQRLALTSSIRRVLMKNKLAQINVPTKVSIHTPVADTNDVSDGGTATTSAVSTTTTRAKKNGETKLSATSMRHITSRGWTTQPSPMTFPRYYDTRSFGFQSSVRLCPKLISRRI